MPPAPPEPRTRLAGLLRRRTLTLLVVGGGLLAVALLVAGELRVRQAVFVKMMEERSATATRELAAFVLPIHDRLGLIRDGALGGDLGLGNAARLEQRLGPLLDRLPQVEAVELLGDGRVAFRIQRQAGAWEAIPEPDVEPRPWYRPGALPEAGTPRWSGLEPGTGGQRGVTVALSWSEAPEGQARGVAIALTDDAIAELAGRLPLTQGTLLVLSARDGAVLWLSPQDRSHFVSSSLSGLMHGEGPWGELISRALVAWHHGERDEQSALRLRAAGQTYWLRFAPSGLPGSGELGLLVPEADLSARLETVTSPYTYALFGVVALGVLVLLRWGARDRRRLLALARPGGAVGSGVDLRQLIAEGESDRLELKSTLRWNLKANKPGKEVELAWLKALVAFMNTDGGTLLVGVDDAGTAIGLAADRFANDDKCLLHLNNLINQHIGLEFSRQLRVELRDLDSQQVLVVDAARANQPAFLRVGDDEDFFIRVGPSSRKLSARKALEYVGRRRTDSDQ